MINQFINQTFSLLKKSDMRFFPTETVPLKFNHEDKDKTVHIQMVVSDTYGGASISSNCILQISIMFSVMDALVDNKYPDLVGQSFKSKYKGLPNGTDDEIMFREVYRLLKTLRNAAVHSMNTISIKEDESITASYTHNGTVFSLDISQLGMNYIYTFIYNYITPQPEELTSNHIKAIQRTIYDSIKQRINSFSDDIGTNLKDISNDLRLGSSRRYIVENPLYEVSPNVIRIQSIYEDGHFPADYLIEHDEKKALIPSEVLRNQEIDVKDIPIWYLS